MERTPTWIFSGKTGSELKDDRWVWGWFVGHVHKNDKDFVFVANVSGEDGANGGKAKEIAKKIIDEIKL